MPARATPPLVARALDDSRAKGFSLSCTSEVGRLLAVLAAARPGGRIAESGTGCGVGTAWLHSGLGADATLVTVDRDRDRAEGAQRLFAGDDRVQVLIGDWRLLEQHAPFDLFFCDGGGKRDDPDAVVELLAPGGMLVLDDFAPSTSWPPMYEGAVDELRLTYLTHPRLSATQVSAAPDHAVVLGTRRP
ncbi:MAG: O-methyltransferase [Motilibacteraceae bacterium]